MNLMRKLRGATSSASSETAEASSSSSHVQLGLMHLKKLFAEYTHPPQPLTDAEKDDKLYNMLPLFCKVFGTSPSSEMNEKFWDILSFCQQVSKLMVSEIRKRASNQSTEAASCAIAKFLEIENSEESSNGWMLLSTLNLLAAGDQSLIQVMTTASIPSTLVKCLYLFFDLPEIPESEADVQDGNSDFTPRERRILLQKIFVQVLVRLCSHPFPCEELARKDDLSLLFSAITSWCAPHNIMWRKSAAEVLMTLSRHGLTQSVVQYIHNKGCVVEMFVAVFCFLKDSSEVSQLLLDDFRSCQGYLFLSEFLLKHERQGVPDYLTSGHNAIFKDVYREVGMLEVFVTCLSRYAVYLKDKQILDEEKTKRESESPPVAPNDSPVAPERKKRQSTRHDSLIRDPNLDDEEEELGALVMEGLTALLNANSNNCNVFRDCGGAKCVHGMVVYESCRSKALVSGSGEEDMSALLCGMHAAPNDALLLKLHILKALLACLRDSHRTRTIFRKVSGFVYVTSVLVSLEGKLKGDEPMDKDMLQLIHIVFYTISTAMRFEPANAKFFHHEVNMYDNSVRDNTTSRMFYQRDGITKRYGTRRRGVIRSVSRNIYEQYSRNDSKPAGRTAPLNLSTGSNNGLYTGCGNKLSYLPRPPEHEAHARAIRDYLAHVLKSLVRSERNQQVMCGAGLAGVVLRVCGGALRAERHPLHAPAMYMLERLAAHALRPSELREFLRMGNPLNCVDPEPGQVCKPGGPVPLTRIKTLVSMTTPRDYRSQNSCTLPPFVEFDMSAEGFGCLYLPSIAPQSANLNALGTQDTATLGGIGSGSWRPSDRVFPPQTGLTYSTWICVEKYSDSRSDPHCVRLLTLVRNINNSRDEHLVCLTMVLSARDKAIIISTQETLVPHNVGEWEPEGSGECGARVWCPDLQHEGQWHHLVLVLNRAVLKNSSFSLYLDGQHMHSGKLHYVSANPGGGAATLSGASSVYCVLGTPPHWRRYSRLVWRQGPALLLEDVLPAQTVSVIYQLGPHYVGTLQAPLPPGQYLDPLAPLVAEEKVVFGINARAMSQLTLAKIRKVYSKNDNKAIAKMLGMSSHENATPIRILHNSAGHLMGPARCLGGTVVGYLGVRVFCPKPAAIMIDTVGGCSVLLGLIAMAQDVECLYASVKALVCVVRSNKAAQAEMDRRKGYQTLAMLLKRKKQLLNSHILHLIFGLVGTVDSQKETSSIPNLTAFQDLICELEVWLGAPGGLIKSLLEHLLELATETAHRTHNLRTMRELQLVSKLLYIINDVKVVSTRNVLIQLLAALLGGQPRPSDLLCLGQFMAYTLPLPTQTEKGVNLKESDTESEGEQIILRNKCFNVIHGLLFTQRNLVNTIVCEEISRVLGVDWLLSFMLENVHPTTVLWALRIMVVLCSGQGQQSAILQRFREGVGNGGWLRHTEMIAQPQQAGVASTSPPTDPRAVLLTIRAGPGAASPGGVLRPRGVGGARVGGGLGGGGAPAAVLFSLYNTLPDFVPIMMMAEVLTALAAILFPPNCTDDIHMPIGESEESSGASTPGSEKEVVLGGTVATAGSLTQHPVRQGVMDFLRLIVLDSLPLNVTGKTAPVIDLVLDASPPNSTSQQQIEYQTEVLTTLMENLLNTELFGSESNISNVCYLAARLVDKLWQGQLSRDPHEVFDFIVKLITQAKKKSSVISLEGLHHCLNRTILFLLSRSTESIADQMSVLEALHKLTTNRLLIFGAGNHELEFIGCLTYCLLQLSSNMKIALDSHMRTTWHVNPSGDLESRDDKLTTHQGRNLMAGAARRVWEELYVCKKPAIEEVFKITLVPPVGNARAPDLTTVREQLNEAAHKLWINYIDIERKVSYTESNRGLTRLASRTKVKKEDSAKQRANPPRDHALAYMQDHVQLVRQAWCGVVGGAALTRLHTQRYVQAEWAGAWRELTRERALWGPRRAPALAKWALDSTEGPSRMRKMLRRNHSFYQHYPYRPDLDDPDNKQLKYKVAQSLDSKEYYRVYQQWRTAGNICEVEGAEPTDIPETTNEPATSGDTSLDVANSDGSPSDLVSSGVVSRGTNQSSGEANEDGPDNEDEDEQPTPPPDNQTLLRLLEHHEKISHMFRCARIQGLDTTEGLLLFGREHCYVIDGFTLLKNREIRDLDSCPDDYEPILPAQGIQRSNQRQCSKFLYEDIREVHKRRYLLQPIALEVFSSDGRNYLLAFPRKVRNKVYSRFTALATGMADSAAGSVAGQKRGVAVEQPGGLLATLIGDTSVTQRWLRGEISNFQYLMHLNTLAGRSYNDLMQYPVFPWILADYDSLELDLNDPATFRDLTKPMGAQSPDRLEQFRKRYKEWDDPHGETPPYHYGTHYSMFHSIKEAWNSASRHNMADVKELIPEFFYLPEFLVNSNNFDLVLPPWARGDAREFIRAHRAALECDYVSHRLHHWIDLVFGYKQTGQPAHDACNVFHHLFYEGNVDIYNSTILDPNNIIPSQGITPPEKLFFHNLENLRPSLQPVKEVKGPVGQILYTEKAILAVEQNKVLMPPTYNKYVAWGFADHSLRIGNYDNDKAIFVCETVAQACGEIVTCGDIATCSGSWLYAWSINGELLGAVDTIGGRERSQQVLCVAFSQTREWDPLNVIITGSTDGVVRMWSIDYIAETAEEQTESIEGGSVDPVSTSTEVHTEKDEQQKLSVQDSEELKSESEVKSERSESETKTEDLQPQDREAAIKRVEELVKQMSLSQEKEGTLTKSGSESSLSDACETTSAKESARRHDEKDTCSDNEEPQQYVEPKEEPVDSCDEAKQEQEYDNEKDLDAEKDLLFICQGGGSIGDSSESCSIDVGGTSVTAEVSEGGLRASKSDTSLTDSFVVVSAPASPASPAPIQKQAAKIQPATVDIVTMLCCILEILLPNIIK
ncbi:hypothetical protein HF086_005479 [Spodoptera exigua]|uniref:WD repeat and FYVE domain-containing protein 3 n=1 Tax=Spodoptera exigua TaxID=7107 RepID=A0A922SE81_SPOEX|nr:hypothetical protein HF086_005479 [Spodoptera exigua]